ncbi:MAG: hypothetical protein ACREBG_30485 [Pyrinomonadaceae bacterium]
MTPEGKRQSYLSRLRKQLVQYFLMDEFIVLCSDLEIPYDELRKGGLEVQADELVQRLENLGRIPDLVAYCSQKRPNVSWEDTDALGGVLKETQDELKGDLATFQASFQSALEQIDILSDYKDLHDKLHDLQFGWFPRVQQEFKSLPDAKNAIQNLFGHERDFRTVIGELYDTVNQKRVPGSEREWIDRMEQARKDLKQGISSPEPAMKLIGSALQSISQVLDTQPTYINGDLMRAVGALRLPQLKNIVQLVLDKLIKKAPDSDLVKQFQQGINDLNQMDVELDALMKEHDIWQGNEVKIPMLLPALSFLPVFNSMWRQLKENTAPLYANKEEEWATDLLRDDAALEKAIGENDVEAAKRAFQGFQRDAKARFLDVDKLIKKRCRDLLEIRSRMWNQ